MKTENVNLLNNPLTRPSASLSLQGRGKQRGFTLIELLVVVLIIGILAAVAVPQYQKAVEKTRLAEVLQNINVIRKCFDLYKLENGLPSAGETAYLEDMNCPIETNLGERNNHVYTSKYFQYEPLCIWTGCYVEIYRIPSYDYTIIMDDRPDNEDTCVTQLTDLGRYICKSIENQGWNYVDDGY